jgi:hypothetical protein
VLEKYSATTMMITASERLVRIPAEIWGAAAGSTIRRIRSRPPSPYERAVSTSVGSIPRTPSIVFSSTGKRQKNAMNATFCTSPIECSKRTEIGSSAGGGMLRQNSMCGIASRRPHRESPSGMPSAIPSTAAIPKPSRMRTRLGTTCSWNCEKSHMSLNSTRIVESRGKYCESACTVHACQRKRIATGTAISAATARVEYVRRLTSSPPVARDASGARGARARS